MGIIVVGMGPGDMSYLTLEAYETLMSGKNVYMRTKRHPVVEELEKRGMKYESFDSVYDGEDTFDSVYTSIVKKLEELEKKSGDIVYAVPGNPFVAERSVELLIERGNVKKLSFVYGSSFIDATLTAVKRDPVNGFSVIDALSVNNSAINPRSDNLFVQVYDSQIASDLKLKLSGIYGDDHECLIVRAAGVKGQETIMTSKIYELDRKEVFDHLTSVFVPKNTNQNADGSLRFFSDLVEVVEELRGENGCPWDIKQTHTSLRENLIEEAYEVVDAIDNDDLYLLEEELGDVLLQVVMHSQIAAESGYFNINDVTTGIVRKLISRHPHVFKDYDIGDADEVIEAWEKIKLEEKNETVTQSMKRIPRKLPILTRAYKIQKKAASIGFDWQEASGALDKLEEEISEFRESVQKGDVNEAEREMGDLIFSIVNVCRFYNINPDISLEKTIKKFIDRFEFVEKNARVDRETGDVNLEQLENFWNTAKKFEK